MTFSILQPPRIVFGRGTAANAPALIRGFGRRILLVHGRTMERSDWLANALSEHKAEVQRYMCYAEPTLDMLEEALKWTKPFDADVVVALGGGAAMDLAKALAALIPARGHPLDHLEVVGKGLPLTAPPLPFVAIPTTAGTGAEVTKNAVIGVPAKRRKVSLRDDRMIARLAVVDPALTDHCARHVTLASGLDAVTQAIEPYVSCKANPYSDAISAPAIGPGLRALRRLMDIEDATARDALAWTSLSGGLALANSGLGAVHGFAGVIGGMTTAAHGAICGALLSPVLSINRARSDGPFKDRLDHVCGTIAEVFGCTAEQAPSALADWAHASGLPRLSEMGVSATDHAEIAKAALGASSMKGNPVMLSQNDMQRILEEAG